MKIDHRGAKTAGLAAFALSCMGIFLWLYTLAGGRLPFSNPYHINVYVPNAFQLVPDSDVRSAGVKIGVVDGITNAGDVAKVSVDVNGQYAPIYKDAQALVRTKTLVGENYLELTPGDPSSGKVRDGGTLPLSHAQEAVQLDSILSSFDAKTRAQVRRDLDSLGPGLAGRGGDLNQLFGTMDPTVSQGALVMNVLRGQQQQVADVIDRTATVMQAFANRTQAMQQLALDARATAVAAAARDQAMGAAIDQLAPTLRQAQESVGRLASFAGRATPVIGNLRAAVTDLRPVMRELGPAAVQGERLFAALPEFLHRADPMLADLRSFSTASLPTVSALEAFLRQLDPPLAYLSPYAQELAVVLPDIGSAVGVTDAVGHVARVHAEINANSIEGLTPTQDKALAALIQSGGFGTFAPEGRNAYPQPGTVGNPQAASNDKRVLAARPAFAKR